MNVKINGKAIQKRLRAQKHDRAKTSIYVSQSLFKRFSRVCGEFSPSEVVEELLNAYIETAKRQ
jgi:hypothetical protein